MCDNQVYDLTTQIEAIKMFMREQFYVIKKALPTLQTNRTNKTIKKLQNFFRNEINFWQKKTNQNLQLLKCLLKVKINRATIKSQQKNLKWLNKKYCKPRNIENEPINCQSRYETLYTDDNDEESENTSDS